MHLIIPPQGHPFISQYFDFENHFVPGMKVFNLTTMEWYNETAHVWEQIDVDTL